MDFWQIIAWTAIAALMLVAGLDHFHLSAQSKRYESLNNEHDRQVNRVKYANAKIANTLGFDYKD